MLQGVLEPIQKAWPHLTKSSVLLLLSFLGAHPKVSSKVQHFNGVIGRKWLLANNTGDFLKHLK